MSAIESSKSALRGRELRVLVVGHPCANRSLPFSRNLSMSRHLLLLTSSLRLSSPRLRQKQVLAATT